MPDPAVSAPKHAGAAAGKGAAADYVASLVPGSSHAGPGWTGRDPATGRRNADAPVERPAGPTIRAAPGAILRPSETPSGNHGPGTGGARGDPEPVGPVRRLKSTTIRPEKAMKGIVAWFLGVPIFVIILLYLTGIF